MKKLEIPLNPFYKKQNQALIEDDYKKAVISAVNPGSRQVDIYFIRNPDTVIRGVAVAAHIPVNDSIIGLRCKVDVFDEVNPKDMVVAYIYGSTTGDTFTVNVITSITIDFVGKTVTSTSTEITFVDGIAVSHT